MKRWGISSWEIGTYRISCASQCTIADMVCTSYDPAGNYPDTRFSEPNQASRTPDFAYPLVFSRLFSSSSSISLFLIHNSTIIPEHNVKSYLCISPCHNHELTTSTVYAGNSIQPRLSFLHSHHYQLTPECSISFRQPSLQNWPPPGSSP